ncbi:MAG: nicotinate-nucleotide adenylyltransferase [bacterium]
MSIAIYGGTFNPIHYGHLIVADEVRQAFQLDKIIFVPSAIPPHKKYEAIIDPQHRYNMTHLAIASNSHFVASTVELDRGGKSYSIDTIKELKKEYKDEKDFFFIMGADAFLEISTWKAADKILELCRFIIVSRPGTSLGKVIKYLSSKDNLPDYLKKNKL